MVISAKVDALIKTMSLREKIGQLNQEACHLENMEQIKAQIRRGELGSVILATSATAGNDSQEHTCADILNALQKIAIEESPSGIPLLFGRDVIHGHKTVFPIPLALSASFNPSLVKESYACIAKEAANDGINWTFAPMIDISRDPRWGRCIEGVGEDPFLGMQMAKAMVEGFQNGDAPLAACAKHYIGYGAVEGGRDYGQSEISDYTLRNVYLRPFEAAIHAGVATVMTAFQEINGTAPSASHSLTYSLLKDELGFDGFVVSDWASIEQLITQGLAQNKRQAALLAIHAGVDMDMSSRCYVDHLEELVQAGLISMAVIDEAVSRILYVKLKFGLFDQPSRPPVPVDHQKHRKMAKACSDESIVLLKNKGSILPLSPQKQIVATGPMLHEKRALLGNWVLDGDESLVTTFADALKQHHPNILLPSSAYLWDDCLPDLHRADAVLVFLGESKKMSGEANSLSRIELPPEQLAYIKRLHAMGKPLIGVMCFGRPIALEEAEIYFDAIIYAWHSGTCTAESVADLLYGQIDPSGKLPMSFPRCSGQIPIYYNHPARARNADAYYREVPTYHDCRSTPLYPFGYGLSYTQFSYDGLYAQPQQLSLQELKEGKSFRISVRVTNVGKRTGKEVVQCYIQDPFASMARPLRELKAFEKITLNPGETRQLTFTLDNEALAFYNGQGKWIVEAGTFTVYAGADCCAALNTDITVKP